MSDAREAVLGRVRRSLGRGDGAAAARATVEARLATPRSNLIPARADLDLEGRIELFTTQAEAVHATVRRVPYHRVLPQAVADYLRANNLQSRLVLATDPQLAGADWASTLLEIRHGRAEDDDAIGLTHAFAGIAETGTVMLLSAAERPTTLAFLPETSIVVVPSGRILRAYEDGLRLLREEHGALPRSVNFITGPSRSGDIEQTLQLGAHGPRRLLLVLVDDVSAAGASSS